jgi:AraC-like DNA-binding protein
MKAGTVSVVLVRPLALSLLGSPDKLAELYAATDLSPEMLADDEARVSPAQFCVAWAAATKLAGDPGLAFRIADATPPGAFGIVEYVCRSSATLGDALRQWCRYLRILDDAVEVALVETEDGHSSVRVVTESDAPAPASHELCFALIVKNARSMLGGDFPVTEVRFTHTLPRQEQETHRAYFGAPVRFGADHTELVLPGSTLDKRLTTADPSLLAILRAPAEAALSRGPVDAPLTDQVKRAIRGALESDDAQLEAVARKLGMTGRSLQRRLKDEGTAFQAVRDEMRKELADRYLGQGMSFSEISFLLGFSEPSAFFRAFKRWTGLTPFERRAALLTG